MVLKYNWVSLSKKLFFRPLKFLKLTFLNLEISLLSVINIPPPKLSSLPFIFMDWLLVPITDQFDREKINDNFLKLFLVLDISLQQNFWGWINDHL